MSGRARVAILISGRGSNMQALVEAADAPDYPAEIAGVFSNRADSAGLTFARSRGIPTAVVSHKDFDSRESFDAALDDVLRGWRTDIVCLAGFMRIFSAGFAEQWTAKMLNIHPSLLPLYRGLHTHERALADRATEHGCTVHLVTPGLDEGPSLAQARVPVLPGDTPETLAARILVEEHRLYPATLAAFIRGDAAHHAI